MLVVYSASSRRPIDIVHTYVLWTPEGSDIYLLKANAAKDCQFTTCLKELLARPNVQQYIQGALYSDGKLDIQKAQCDQLTGWDSFMHKVFGMDPNTCSSHLTGTHHLFSRGMFTDQLFLSGIAADG